MYKNLKLSNPNIIPSTMDVSFTVGEKFSNYAALSSKIEQYQRANNVQLYKRSSRSIDAAKTRCPKKTFNDQLKFSEITFSCIHGGKKFEQRGTGKRNQRYAYIFLSVFLSVCLPARPSVRPSVRTFRVRGFNFVTTLSFIP